MTVPASIVTELTALQAQLTAAQPVESASAPTIVALQLNAAQALSDLDTALTNAAGANTNNFSGAIVFSQNPTPLSSITLGGQPLVAGASWTTASTQITLGFTAPSWVQNGMQCFDVTTNQVIGIILGVSGITITLALPAAFPSQGSSDLLAFQSVITFVTSAPITNNVVIQSTLQDTLLTLILFLSGSGRDINISSCSYSIAATSNLLQIVYSSGSPIPSSGFTVATNVPGATAISSKLIANDLDDWSAPSDPLLIVDGFLTVVDNATTQNTLCNAVGYIGRLSTNLDQLV